MFFAIATLLTAVFIWGLFGGLPSFLRTTTPVYLKPDSAPGVNVGARVERAGIDVGYVHNVEFANGGITIELRIFDDTPLHKSDVCVIHRLHRYDMASLHIEPSIGDPNASLVPLGDPPVMRCVIANGAWPELPGLYEEREN